MNRCCAAVVVSEATQCAAANQRRFNFLMRAGNDVRGDETVTDTLTGIRTGSNGRVHGTGFTAHHHGDVTTTHIFTTDQGHFHCLGHCIRCLDGGDHAAGFNHAKGNALH